MKKIEFICACTDGTLSIPTWAKHELMHLFEGKQVRVLVKSGGRQRSTWQNRYYWGVVVPLLAQGLSDMEGETISLDLAHDFIKRKFWPETGQVIQGHFIGFTTTAATTAEWEEKMGEIRHWAATFLNVQIPEPNEEEEHHHSRRHNL